MRLTIRWGTTALFLIGLLAGPASAQFLNDWEGQWVRLTEEFGGFCEIGTGLEKDGGRREAFLHVTGLYQVPDYVFSADLFERSPEGWRYTAILIYPFLGTGADLAAWFQDTDLLILSGYIRMVMRPDGRGGWVPAAVKTVGANYFDGFKGCAWALAAKGKVVPGDRVPAEILQR